jgi:anti-sigma factor (TIGR02949 family)
MRLEDKLDCQESQSLMTAYIDGELDAATAIRFAPHLANCKACADAYRNLTALRSAVKTHGIHYSAPEYLRHRIKSALPRAVQHKKPVKFPWAWINFGVATACSFAFAVTLALYMTVPSAEDMREQEVVASHARSLMVEHLSDVVSTDHHTVKPWFSGKLDYSPTVYTFAEQGFTLVGGRMDFLDQQPVAAMAYRHGLHVLNLFVWPDAEHKDTPQAASSRQGYQLVHWSQDGMRYWAISDMNARELSDFVGLVKTQIQKEERKG